MDLKLNLNTHMDVCCIYTDLRLQPKAHLRDISQVSLSRLSVYTLRLNMMNACQNALDPCLPPIIQSKYRPLLCCLVVGR